MVAVKLQHNEVYIISGTLGSWNSFEIILKKDWTLDSKDCLTHSLLLVAPSRTGSSVVFFFVVVLFCFSFLSLSFEIELINPEGIWCQNNVVSTSFLRRVPAGKYMNLFPCFTAFSPRGTA